MRLSYSDLITSLHSIQCVNRYFAYQQECLPSSPFIPTFLPLLALRQVVPSVHEAAAQSPERKPPPAPRRPHAVRPFPQGHRPHAGPSAAVLEVRVYQGQSGCG